MKKIAGAVGAFLRASTIKEAAEFKEEDHHSKGSQITTGSPPMISLKHNKTGAGSSHAVGGLTPMSNHAAANNTPKTAANHSPQVYKESKFATQKKLSGMNLGKPNGPPDG